MLVRTNNPKPVEVPAIAPFVETTATTEPPSEISHSVRHSSRLVNMVVENTK